ncbi:MAG: ABC transporter permease [Candidatus Omnitrophota bacterium]
MFELFHYGELLKNLVVKDLKLTYKNSFLGFFWSLLNPLLRTFIFYFVFTKIFRIGIEHYVIYLLSGILAWMFFANSLNFATRSIVDNSALIKKVYFPREIYPVSSTLAQLINFALALIILFLWVFFSKIDMGLSLIYLPLIIVLQLIFTIGVGLLFATIYVFVRDLGHLLELILMAWMYMTPIFYNVDMVPERFRQIYLLNPMAALLSFYRDIILYNHCPGLKLLAVTFLTSLFTLIIGWLIFNHYSKRFAEEI